MTSSPLLLHHRHVSNKYRYRSPIKPDTGSLTCHVSSPMDPMRSFHVRSPHPCGIPDKPAHPVVNRHVIMWSCHVSNPHRCGIPDKPARPVVNRHVITQPMQSCHVSTPYRCGIPNRPARQIVNRHVITQPMRSCHISTPYRYKSPDTGGLNCHVSIPMGRCHLSNLYRYKGPDTGGLNCHVSVPMGRCHVSNPYGNKILDTRGLNCHVSTGYGGRKGLEARAFSLIGGGNEADVIWDAGATVAALGGAYLLVLGFDSLTRQNIIQQSLSRKLVHILSGLLFMAFWPIFSNSTGARYFASLVPLANCLRLLTYGLSLASDEGLIKSVTREGKPEELLRGPLYYVLVLIFCVLVFWRDSPIGVISLAMMCGGDGIADIVGRKFGSVKIPYNQNKSWAGSISMFVFGSLVSIGMLYYFSALGYFDLDWSQTMQKVALVSSVATFVESLSTTDTVDDNISVPLASMVTAFFCFQ